MLKTSIQFTLCKSIVIGLGLALSQFGYSTAALKMPPLATDKFGIDLMEDQDFSQYEVLNNRMFKLKFHLNKILFSVAEIENKDYKILVLRNVRDEIDELKNEFDRLIEEGTGEKSRDARSHRKKSSKKTLCRQCEKKAAKSTSCTFGQKSLWGILMNAK